MLTAKNILLQVKKITSNLIELGLCIDQNFPSIIELPNKITDVSFCEVESSNNFSIVLKNLPYTDLYNELYKLRMFNIKMLDGALIQMQYRFYGNSIEKHRLAFFPSPDLKAFQNEPDLYIHDEIYSDILDCRIVTVPLRFDYDNSKDINGNPVAKPLLHPIAHLTIGQFKNCRIPVSSAITPFQFIDFIIRNFYNTAHRKYSDKLIQDKSYFDTSIYPEERGIIHINSPIH